jgi:phosphoserine phosphatase
MTTLHVFDMDGTLLRGTTASIEIARALNRLPDLLDLEKSFAEGLLTTYEFAVAAYDLYRELADSTVEEIFAASPWMTGLAEVMADIRRRGEFSLVITMSPAFFADLLTTKGVAEVRASRFPPLPMRQPPDPAAILTPTDKVPIVGEVLARHGISPQRCVAYGDSSSDLPLFGQVRRSVAVNATPQLRGVAAVSFDGLDLWGAYQAGRHLLE